MSARTEYRVTIDNVGLVYSGFKLADARREFAECVECAKAPRGRMAGERVTLWKDGEPYQEFEPSAPADECARFLAYCAERTHAADLAGNTEAREFWRRLAGSVRKASTMI